RYAARTQRRRHAPRSPWRRRSGRSGGSWRRRGAGTCRDSFGFLARARSVKGTRRRWCGMRTGALPHGSCCLASARTCEEEQQQQKREMKVGRVSGYVDGGSSIACHFRKEIQMHNTRQ
ncbi:hypothetical protein DQ04_26571000, partial [Trypanosoma grayi]|uniref:hypothetical protein n=1 Tax=Trypanosoma grayi TaxID=71804 RepID=UPI0004F3F578